KCNLLKIREVDEILILKEWLESMGKNIYDIYTPKEYDDPDDRLAAIKNIISLESPNEKIIEEEVRWAIYSNCNNIIKIFIDNGLDISIIKSDPSFNETDIGSLLSYFLEKDVDINKILDIYTH